MSTAFAVFLAIFFAVDIAIVIFVLTRKPPESKEIPKPTAAPMSRWQASLFAIFAIGFCAGVVSFDFIIIRNALRHHRAQSFEPADAKVLKCEMTENSDGEGTTYSVDFEYVYRVAGQEFHGTRVRYYALWDRTWVKDFVDRYPAGSRITIYHDPTDPQEAVFLREWDGGLLFAGLFMMPFNFVLAVAIVLSVLWMTNRLPPAPSVRVVETTEGIRISPPTHHPIRSALIAVIASTLLTAAPIMCCGGMPPNIPTMIVAWLIVIGITVWAIRRAIQLRASGRDDIIVNYQRQQIELPLQRNESQRTEVPFAKVANIDVKAIEQGESIVHCVVVNWGIAPSAQQRQIELETEEHAVLIANLLRAAIEVRT